MLRAPASGSTDLIDEGWRAEFHRQRIATIHVRGDEARLLAEIDRLHRELQQMREEVASQPASLVRKMIR